MEIPSKAVVTQYTITLIDTYNINTGKSIGLSFVLSYWR